MTQQETLYLFTIKHHPPHMIVITADCPKNAPSPIPVLGGTPTATAPILMENGKPERIKAFYGTNSLVPTLSPSLR